MPRARSKIYNDWREEHPHSQTAAAEQEPGRGCLSGFILPPLAVLLISCLLAILALRQPDNAQAQSGIPHTSTVSTTSLAPFFRPEVLYWSDSILRWAAASSLDPNLVAVVMQIESCGDPRATSRAGALGLFQVMPFHFYITDDPYDPDTNAARGLAYLARSLQAAGGETRLALAGYNGGIGVISRAEWVWPAETVRYVTFGAPMYEDAHSGSTSSVALNEWYAKYGVGLCRQASENQ